MEKTEKITARGLIVTTLTQSLGTFLLVTLVFGIIFGVTGVPIYLAFVFGGIALATAPAPALSIVKEFHASGPVTDTLLPMAVLDDVVAIVVFFTVNSVVSGFASGGSLPLLYDTSDDIATNSYRHNCRTSGRTAPEKSKRAYTNISRPDCRHNIDRRYRLVRQYEIIRNNAELYVDGRFIFRRIYKYGE